MTREEKLEEFLPIIKRVAKRVASAHHYVEAADLEQELICFVLKRLSSEEKPLPLPGDAKMNTQSFLTQVARVYCFQQKQQHYLIDPNASYEVGDIRRLLETHFDPSLWDAVREDESIEEAVAAHSDMAWALDRLKPADKQFVADCYTAPKLPASGTKEYRKLRDIIIKIANMLNHWTRRDEGDGPGRRHSMSNASARAEIDSLH